MNNRLQIYKYLHDQHCDRSITDLVIHCTATKRGQNVTVDIVDEWHKVRGFSKQKGSGRYCGYHFLILEDGIIQIGRHLDEVGAHVAGTNSKSIGICYAGGINNIDKGEDTRTHEQKESLLFLLQQLIVKFPEATIKGHRDYSPDKNGNGVIEPWEYMKECPCFDAIEEYKNI